MLTFNELEAFLLSIDGILALSTFVLDEKRTFDVAFIRKEKPVRFSGDTLEVAMRQAIAPQEKRCSRCGQVKDLAEFGKHSDKKRGHKDGRASHCLVCDRLRKRKWYKRVARKHAQTHVSMLEPPAQGRPAVTRSPLEN